MFRTIRSSMIIFVLGISSFVFADLKYSIVDLGSTADYTGIFKLNDKGQCLLFYESGIGNGEYHSYLWDHGNVTELDNLYWSMNNVGQMVSDSLFRDSDGTVSFVSGKAFGGYTIGGGNVINDAHQYVGTSRSSNDLPRATIWNFATGTCQWMEAVNEYDLGSYATAVNNSCQVVGTYCYLSEVESYPGAFFWDPVADTVISLGGNIRTYHINDAGQVLCDDYNGHYYLWENGEFRDLGALMACSINNAGVIAGIVQNEYAQCNAVLWHNNVITYLDDCLPAGSGWNLQYASDINNLGQIVGAGTLNGEEHAFLLTPIPEPATLALLALGGLTLLRRRKPE